MARNTAPPSARSFVATLLGVGLFVACSGVSRDPLASAGGRGGTSAGTGAFGGGDSTGGTAAPASGGSAVAAGGAGGDARPTTDGGDGGVARPTTDGGDGGVAHSGSAGDTALAGAGSPGGSGEPGGRAGSGGGDPEPVSSEGLLYWFSADSGVTETDGIVSEWLDRSSNEVVAAQPSSELRPRLGKFGHTAMPGIIFDGQDDHLVLPPLVASFEEGLTFFVVARATVGKECMSMLELSNGTEIDDVGFFRYMHTFTYEVVDKNVYGQLGVFGVESALLFDLTHTPDQAVSLFLNGLATGAAAFAVPASITREQVFFGRSLYTDCTYWTGELAEILLYTRPLPTGERQEIRRYLSQKYSCCGG